MQVDLRFRLLAARGPGASFTLTSLVQYVLLRCSANRVLLLQSNLDRKLNHNSLLTHPVI